MTATVNYAAGTALPASQCINISTTDDDVLEGDHEFTVTIVETSAVPEAIVIISVPSSTQTVVIKDDESKSINKHAMEC